MQSNQCNQVDDAVDGAVPEVSDALLALDLVQGVGARAVHGLLDVFGSAEGVLKAQPDSIRERTGCDHARAGACREAFARALDLVTAEREAARRVGCLMLGIEDPRYPWLLGSIPDPPLIMRVRGTLPAMIGARQQPVIAIVGSRRPTTYGLRQAGRFARFFGEHGFHIVSGGARGIDAAAHREALLRAGGTTAVLGSGLGVPYPPEHVTLFDSIVAAGGCVASEYPVHAPPRPARFPRRNRIVSGLSVAVLVVEAAARSGALITARLAIEEQGRDAMAIPGRVDDPCSAGCLRMIREGWATLVSTPEEALEALEGASALLRAAEAPKQVGLQREIP
ncbi:MAG: DNA-processing protein DprA [Phycisphaerales bacterium]|nr:DNA-processing protein DprA [Phycisphaerales bacterium]